MYFLFWQLNIMTQKGRCEHRIRGPRPSMPEGGDAGSSSLQPVSWPLLHPEGPLAHACDGPAPCKTQPPP